MDEPRVSGPALVVHAFFESSLLHGAGSHDVREQLSAFWSVCERLCAGGGAGVGVAAASGIPQLAEFSPAWKVSAEHHGTGQFRGRHALLWTRLDITGISLRLVADSSSWPDLLNRWTAATNTLVLQEAVGLALILCGTSRLASDSDSAIVRGTAALTSALAPATVNSYVPVVRTPGPWSRTGRGLLIWDPDDGVGWPTERRMALLAPRGGHPEAWCWSEPTTAALAPLTLHLLNAAKVRQQFQVLTEYYPGTVADDREVEAAANTLGRAHEEALTARTPASGRRDGELAHAMERLRGSAHKLAARRSSLRTLGRAFDLLLGNMNAAMPAEAQDRPGSALVSDRLLASELSQRAKDLADDLEETLDRALAVIDLAGGYVTAEVERRRGHAVKVQSAIIAGILMFLGAVQAFQYRIAVTPVLRSPLICVAACLALSAPAGLQRLLPGGRLLRGPSLFDSATLGALTGTGTWLLCTALAQAQWHHRMATSWSLGASLAVAAITVALSTWAFLRARV